MKNTKFYKSIWFMWICGILCPPVGIVLLWLHHKDMSENKKLVITGIFLAVFVIAIGFSLGGNNSNTGGVVSNPEIMTEIATVSDNTVDDSSEDERNFQYIHEDKQETSEDYVADSTSVEEATDIDNTISDDKTADDKKSDAVSSDNTDIEIASNSDDLSLATTIESVSVSDKKKSNSKTLKINKKLKYSDIPEYSGLPIAEVHNDKPFFRKKDKKTYKPGTEYYSPLDELGRCGVAYACVGVDTIPDENEQRGEIGQIRPSGWHTVKYADIIPDLYLYNRCHLIGWQLGAENANECNLITGTRYMNVSGMLPYENMIADYVRRSGNHVMYRVTPYFMDDELVARGVLLEAQSIETTDISFCVWCYNVQPGIIIDYETGDSQVDEHYTVQITAGNEGYAKSGDTADSSGTSGTGNSTSSGTSPGMGEDKEIASETTYVLNTNRGHCYSSRW